MTLALLWGSALAPAITHARDAGSEHSAEMLQLDAAAATEDSQPGEGSGKSGDTATHHHCTIAVEADPAAVESNAPLGRETVTPGLSRSLGSLAQAPPIEPPAA